VTHRAAACGAVALLGRLLMSGEVMFSARAVRRLRLAAALLRLVVDEGEGCAVRCQRVLDRINRLGAVQRQRLRDQVDWVEAYERVEDDVADRGARMFIAAVHRPVDGRWSPLPKAASTGRSRCRAHRDATGWRSEVK
jgi:hypothetical protein